MTSYVKSNAQNRNRGIDTWNRLTAVRGKGHWWGWLEEKVNGLSKKYIYIVCLERVQPLLI